MELKNLGNLAVNNYLVKIEDGWLLVDTGYPKAYKKFKKKLKKHGVAPEDIKAVFLTHYHDDHTGFVKELMEEFQGIKLFLHPVCAERIKGGMHVFESGGATSRRTLFSCRVVEMFKDGWHCFPKVDIKDRTYLWDGERRFLHEFGINAEIIHLPGHTPGSIGLLLPDGLFFIGDAAMNIPVVSSKNRSIVIEDPLRYASSWDTILSCNADTLFVGHGRPFSPKKIAKNRKYADKIKTYDIKPKKPASMGK